MPANSEPSVLDGVRTGDQCLADVAGVLESAVADHRDPGLARHLRGEVDRRDLGDAHTRDDARRADRGTRAHADLDGIGTRVDERLCSSVVATLPPMIWTSRNAGSDLSVRIISVTPRA